MSQMQAPPITKANKYLLIVLVALFIAHSLGQALGMFSLVQLFGLVPSALFPLRVHTLFTYPWVEAHLMSVLFNGLALWFIGSELERSWGTRVYLKFLLTAVFAAGLCYALFASLILRGTWLGGGVLVGSAGLTYSLCVAYAVLYPDRQFYMMFAFPVKARYFCLIIAAVELYLGLFSGNPASWGHLFSMLTGFLLIRFQGLPAISWWFREGSKKGPNPRKNASAQHLRLVKDEEDPPKYWH